MAGLLDSLFNRRTANSSGAIARATGNVGRAMWASTGPVGNWDINKAIRDGMEKVIWVFRAVDAIASKQAEQTIVLRMGDARTGKIIDDPWLFNLLNGQSNPYEESWAFRYRLSAQLLLSRKGAFVEVVRANNGRPVQLHLLPPENVNPIPDPTGALFVLRYEVTRTDGQIDKLAPDQVIWIKAKPHPTDPYRQMTPMVSAGIAADTDWLARMFNRNFLANDGRPSLLITIAGDLDPEDALELKRRFGGGPATAGQVSVIEGDGVEVTNLSATPADVQWQAGITGTKSDILLAFGVPESIIGNAADRTFANADAEYEIFWMHTEVGHCDAIARGLNALTGDLADNINLAFDYGNVDVLQRQIQAKQAMVRENFMAGLATVDDFMVVNGKEPWNLPGTRALFLPSGMVIPMQAGDDEIIKNYPNVAAAAIAAETRANASVQVAGDRGTSAPGSAPSLPPSAAQQASVGTRPPSAATQAEHASVTNILEARARRIAAVAGQKSMLAIEQKSIEIVDAEIIDDGSREHAYKTLRTTVEGIIEGVLASWDYQQEKVFIERLDHSGFRKGTRHWEGQPGTKALNPDYVVNTDKWASDIKAQMESVIRPVLEREARKTARELKRAGILQQILDRGLGDPTSSAPLTQLFGDNPMNNPVTKTLNSLLDIVDASARRQSLRIADMVQEMDQQGKSLTDIKTAITKQVGARSGWRRQLAINLTTSGVEGVKHAIYGSQAGGYMTKRWNTEDDERVRHTHQLVEGVSIPGTNRFTVGESKLLYPGDPMGPLDEIINCRCWLDWRPNTANR